MTLDPETLAEWQVAAHFYYTVARGGMSPLLQASLRRLFNTPGFAQDPLQALESLSSPLEGDAAGERMLEHGLHDFVEETLRKRDV